MPATKFTRRGLLSRLSLLGGTGLLMLFQSKSSRAHVADGAVGPRDLARPRTSQLPTGGQYDHATQEMQGYDLKLADTGTRTDEDQGNSTTFWDGERK